MAGEEHSYSCCVQRGGGWSARRRWALACSVQVSSLGGVGLRSVLVGVLVERRGGGRGSEGRRLLVPLVGALEAQTLPVSLVRRQGAIKGGAADWRGVGGVLAQWEAAYVRRAETLGDGGVLRVFAEEVDRGRRRRRRGGSR